MKWFALHSQSYARHSLFLVAFASGCSVFWFVAVDMQSLTVSGFSRSVFLLSCLSISSMLVLVFCALPLFGVPEGFLL